MQQTRREFLKNTAVLACSGLAIPSSTFAQAKAAAITPALPWYRRTVRWGQTNITEADAATFDVTWWRGYWKRTAIQGLIVNAGGIVAYYPTREPLQFRPPTLGSRDLFGEITSAAREKGLIVLARMDSNRAHEPLYNAHPDWVAVDASGRPHRAGDLYITCVNGPYYTEYLPKILLEIIELYHPDGFADNSWSGLGRDQICFCQNCRKQFREKYHHELPEHKDWDSPIYRDWILWNYERRLQLWDLNNQVTKAAGGPNCLWIGMNSGSISGQCQSFRDYKAICARAELILLDHQARGEDSSFSQNGDAAQIVHQLLGWDKLVPESMAMYQAGQPTFRKSSKPKTEAQQWMLDGIAGGLQPWWHHVGGQQEDQRQFEIAEPIYRWCENNEEFLVNREPIASVGLLWSQQNTDFFGRDHPREQVDLPWRGWTQALTEERIPYLPVHADDLESEARRFRVLILPSVGALSAAQAESVRKLAGRGCSVIASGRTSLYDEWGKPRSDFALADLLGAQYVSLGREAERPRESFGETLHSYLRISAESPADFLASRSDVLQGFEGTEILPFGGWLGDVIPAKDSRVLLTYIPPFPIYPPETSWMREPRTHIPGLLVSAFEPARVAFLLADLDRRFAMHGLPDHRRVLCNLVRWATRNQAPVEVQGPGLIDCRLYRQGDRLILHLVNLTSATPSRYPMEEILPLGPIKIQLPLPAGIRRKRVRLLVSSDKPRSALHNDRLTVSLPLLRQHEVLVVG